MHRVFKKIKREQKGREKIRCNEEGGQDSIAGVVECIFCAFKGRGGICSILYQQHLQSTIDRACMRNITAGGLVMNCYRFYENSVTKWFWVWFAFL